MAEIIVSEGQSLMDVALWLLGGVEGAFALADANGLAITDALVAGQVLVVPDAAAVRAEVVDYYATSDYRVNTWAPSQPAPAVRRRDFKLIDFLPSDFS